MKSDQFQYDEQSGQVFQETEFRVRKRQGADWIGELKSPSLFRPRRPNPGPGARRLKDMVKTMVATQTRSLSPAHLADVPWCLAEQIYEEIVARYVQRTGLASLGGTV